MVRAKTKKTATAAAPTRKRPRDLRANTTPTPNSGLAFRFQDVLIEKSLTEGLPKGARTLLKLKAGAAAALQEVPYQNLRVADIVKQAQVSHGLFYHYFKDREQIVIEVLAEMIQNGERVYRDIHAVDDDFESIFVPNLFYLDLYRQNSGLMRACLTLSEDVDC